MKPHQSPRATVPSTDVKAGPSSKGTTKGSPQKVNDTVNIRRTLELANIERRNRAKDAHFRIKPERRFGSKVQQWNKSSVLVELNSLLTPKQKAIFRKTPFGHFLDVPEITFQAQLFHSMLLREVHQRNDDSEFWFKIGGSLARFSISEFALITGLKCVGNVDVSIFEEIKGGLRNTLFPKKEDKIRKDKVSILFNDSSFRRENTDEVVVKLAIVHFLANYLFGTQTETRVDNYFFAMVDSGLSELKNFAFGKLLWQRTRSVMRSVLKDCNSIYDNVPRKNDGTLGNFSYKVYGFPVSFIIFIYETLPVCSESLCCRVNSLYPRIVNWTSRASVSFQHVAEKVLLEGEYEINILYPTTEEKQQSYMRGLMFDFEFLPIVPRSDRAGRGSDIQVDLSAIESKLGEVQDSQKSIVAAISDLKSSFAAQFSCVRSAVQRLQASMRGGTDPIVDVCDGVAMDDVESGSEHGFDQPSSSPHDNFRVDDEFDNAFVAELDRSVKVSTKLFPRVSGNYCDSKATASETVVSESIVSEPAATKVICVDESVDLKGDSKRQVKPNSFRRSLFLTKFGSSDVYGQNKRKMPLLDAICPFSNDFGDNHTKEQLSEFELWIISGLKKRNKIKKYAEDTIVPSLDFTFVFISEKTWFYNLYCGGRFLDSTHIDVIMYYLRRKIKLSNELSRRVSTTNCSFSQSVVSLYEKFQKKDSDVFKIDPNCLAMKIMKGETIYCGSHWKDLDDIVIPVNVQAISHWLLLHFSVCNRSLTVYDSMSGQRHLVYSLPIVEAFSVMIPLMLEYIDFYSRSDINPDFSPYNVVKHAPLSVIIADGTPQQADCDCGVFTAYFAEQVILGKESELQGKNVDINLIRKDIAVSLYFHAKGKKADGYITSDEYGERKMEKRLKKFKIGV